MASKMNRYQVRDLMKNMLLDWILAEIEKHSRQGDTNNVKHWATALVRITDSNEPETIEEEFIQYLRVVTDFNDEQYMLMMKTFHID